MPRPASALCRPSRSKDVEIHRATPWPTDETGCLSPNGGWVGSICRYPTTTLATRKSQVATRQAFCRTVGSRPSGERHKSAGAGAGGKGHTPHVWSGIQRSQGSRSKRPGSKSLVKPPSPPWKRRDRGGGEREGYVLVFSGPETDAALLEGARISLCTGTGGWHTRAGLTAIYRY